MILIHPVLCCFICNMQAKAADGSDSDGGKKRKRGAKRKKKVYTCVIMSNVKQ